MVAQLSFSLGRGLIVEINETCILLFVLTECKMGLCLETYEKWLIMTRWVMWTIGNERKCTESAELIVYWGCYVIKTIFLQMTYFLWGVNTLW